jgi:dihydrofolate reductase
MRKLILQMQMSVDGYVGADGDGMDWQVWNFGDEWDWDDELKRDFNATFQAIDCILLSRKMIEQGYLNHWGRAAVNHSADPHYAFAKKIVDIEKVVLTNKPVNRTWARATIAGGDFVEAALALKRQKGENIIAFGGAGFASSLVAAGLVDEIQLYVNPATLGRGRSIFRGPPNEARKLKLLGSKSYSCGMVVNRYELAMRAL